MTTSTFDDSPSPATTAAPVSNWQRILWREWRACEDEEYAAYLYDLIAYERVDWLAWAVLTGWGALAGALGGWLTALLLEPAGEKAGLVGPFVVTGLVGGGIVGWAATLGAHPGRPMTWSVWLRCLVPDKSSPRTREARGASLFFMAVVGLGSGLGVSITRRILRQVFGEVRE